jgi:hypothetical protein
MLLDEKRNVELAASSNVPYHEVSMELIEFCTSCDDQEVIINISIPFSGHIVALPAASQAIRVYLDGDAYFEVVGPQVTAQYWNGELLLNAGAFPSEVNFPITGHLSGMIKKVIPKAGNHQIRVQSSGATIGTVSTIKSQRRYQVWT